MKTVKILVASVCVAFLAVSCQKNVEEIAPVQEKAQLTTITCAFPSMTDQNGTKVSLDASGNTGWQEGDKIVIYGDRNSVSGNAETHVDPIIHTLTAAEVTDPSKAVFEVDLSGLVADPEGEAPFNAAYPADSWDFYSDWYSSARARFDNTNQLLLAGNINAGTMTLYNLNAAILFKVDGDYDSYNFLGAAGTETVGYLDYLCEMNKDEADQVYRKKYLKSYGTSGPLTKITGTVNGDGSTYNHIFLPVNIDSAQDPGDAEYYSSENGADKVSLPNGFTIQLMKSGVVKKYITSSAPLTLSPGHMIDLGLLPNSKMRDYEAIPASEKATAIDLSDDETYHRSANCYVVSAAGTANDGKVFKFRTVKGNSYVKGSSDGTSVGSVVAAELLWETWNNNSTVTAKSIIQEVEYKEGFVYFKTANPLHEGNAVIAAKDSEGTILWSWHIWVPLTDYTYDKYDISEVNMMSRNLGALIDAGDGNVIAHGLFYQWGRKDPFVGQGAHGSSSFAKVAGVGKTNRDSAFTSEAELAANPTVYGAVKAGWYTGDFTAFWGNTKTIYDPCPPGWKVPYKDDDQTKLFTSDITAISGWDYQPVADKYYAQIGSTKFPICGYIYYNGNIDGRENKFRVWSSKSRVNSSTVVVGSWLQIDNSSGTATVTRTDERAAYGCIVRCVAE